MIPIAFLSYLGQPLYIYPNEARYAREDAESDRWKASSVIEELKPKAREAGLWNMFVPPTNGGPPVHLYEFDGTPPTNLEYAPMAEKMGCVGWSSEVFNCSAPNTGNMEVLARYGTKAQQDEWLVPLSNRKILSTFLMTEPAVASSDATNI